MMVGVKVVSVEKRDTPTRYDLFHVRVGYGLDESDVLIGGMIIHYLFFPAEGAKTQAVAVFPPPRRPFYT